MIIEDPLAGLPRLGEDALGACVKCDRVMLATQLPLFLRFAVQRCGIDATEVRRHVGLAHAIVPSDLSAGLQLASIMGPRPEPVVVMDSFEAVNVCMACAEDITANEVLFLAMARAEAAQSKGEKAHA